jgi:hypothetical protein
MVTVSQKWDKRVGQWHDHVTSAAAFGKVRDGILVVSQPQPSDVCVDLGAGTGWRIAKNLGRYGLRVGPEHPATPEFWQQALRDAGLAAVCFEPVAAEAGIVCGARPPSGQGSQ